MALKWFRGGRELTVEESRTARTGLRMRNNRNGGSVGRGLMVLTWAAMLLAALPAPAGAMPTWAPAATASIHPGVVTTTGNSQCTSNFVFYDSTDVYIGQAAHCSLASQDPLAVTQPNGCLSPSLPVGTPVQVEGASKPGVMVYNSWIKMQERGEKDPNACAYNDFALVRLDPADRGGVNPSIPVWGGPTGLSSKTSPGDKVLSYGASPLLLGISQLSPRQGISRGQTGGGWSHRVYTLTPGIPGDSGSGFIDAQGRAFGVLSTLGLLPDPLSNGVGDLSRELLYLRAYSDLRITLAAGTEPFTGSRSSLDPVLPLLDAVTSLLEQLLAPLR